MSLQDLLWVVPLVLFVVWPIMNQDEKGDPLS